MGSSPTFSSIRGIAPLIIIAILAVLAGGAWAVKPALFGGAAKRAATSTQTTQALEDATKAQGAAAASSLAKIGEVVGTLPPSPAHDFIGREIPLALSLLPNPDPMKLIEAERRRAAVMEGRAIEAERLYGDASLKAARLQKERDEALQARRAADLALEQAAAAEHARTLQLVAAGLVALLLLAGWVWARAHSLSPDLIGKMAADIRQGVHPITAIDNYLAPRLHAAVEKAAKLATPLMPPVPK